MFRLPFTLGLLGLVPALGDQRNPFLGQTLHVHRVFDANFDAAMSTSSSGAERDNILKMKNTPTAFWVDSKDKIRGIGTQTAEGVLLAAATKSTPELVVLVWYDLPNRDCGAKSGGEFCCTKTAKGGCNFTADATCLDGLTAYKTEYVDPLVALLKEYNSRLQVVVVMEPSALVNLATSKKDPACGSKSTQTAYREGLTYAVNQVTTEAPNVAVYLDAAHGGWLGWENSLKVFMKTLKGLSFPWSSIRGFATNVGNHQPLGEQCPWCPDQGFRNGYCLEGKHKENPCCQDPCGLLKMWNFGNNELNYAAGLTAAARSSLGMEAHVIIDTSRNGAASGGKQVCYDTCNPRDAGVGVPSSAQTANGSVVDAYFWVKHPGDSDGCFGDLDDGTKCENPYKKCGSKESLGSLPGEPRPTPAKSWYTFQVQSLAKNAAFQAPSPQQFPGVCGDVPQAAAPSTTPPVATVKVAKVAPKRPVVHSCVPPACSPVLVNESMLPAQKPAAPTRVSSQTCAGAYQQCGGAGWLGTTCCQDGCQCVGNVGFYRQCVPAKGATGKCGRDFKYSTFPPPKTSSTMNNLRSFDILSGGWAKKTTTEATTTEKPKPAGLPTVPPLLPVMTAPDAPMPHLQPVATMPPMPTLPPLVTFAPLLWLQPTAEPTTTQKPTQRITQPPTSTSIAGPSWVQKELERKTDEALCAAPYAQCGGDGWKGPTCCDGYCSCEVVNSRKSHCVPHLHLQHAKAGPQKTGDNLEVIFKEEQVPAAMNLPATRAMPWVMLPVTAAAAALLVMVRRALRDSYTPLLGQREEQCTSLAGMEAA